MYHNISLYIFPYISYRVLLSMCIFIGLSVTLRNRNRNDFNVYLAHAAVLIPPATFHRPHFTAHLSPPTYCAQSGRARERQWQLQQYRSMMILTGSDDSAGQRLKAHCRIYFFISHACLISFLIIRCRRWKLIPWMANKYEKL